MNETKTVLAWHFINDDYTLNHDMKGMKAEPGLVVEVDPERLELCHYGLHGSIDPLDALEYTNSAIVCRTEHSGKILYGDDKLVSSSRKVLWIADVTRTLHEFGIWCAERALALIESPDPRIIEALRVKRLWLDDKATDDELAAASAAASAAAWAAASAADRAAAWAAARDTDRDTASAAASAAAWAADRAADRAAQNKQLERMLLEAQKENES